MSLESIGLETSSALSVGSADPSDSSPPVLCRPSAGRGVIVQGRGGRRYSPPGRGRLWANSPRFAADDPRGEDLRSPSAGTEARHLTHQDTTSQKRTYKHLGVCRSLKVRYDLDY